MPGFGTMNTRSIIKTWIAPFNLSRCLWALESTSLTSDSTRRLSIQHGLTMAPRETPDIAAHRGMLIPAIQRLLLGARRLLLSIRTPMRFASAHCITSGSMPTKGLILRMQQSASSKPGRQSVLPFRPREASQHQHRHLHLQLHLQLLLALHPRQQRL
jgi:hypothetical protein